MMIVDATGLKIFLTTTSVSPSKTATSIVIVRDVDLFSKTPTISYLTLNAHTCVMNRDFFCREYHEMDPSKVAHQKILEKFQASIMKVVNSKGFDKSKLPYYLVAMSDFDANIFDVT